MDYGGWKSEDGTRSIEVDWRPGSSPVVYKFRDSVGVVQRRYKSVEDAQKDYDDFKAGKLDVLIISARVGFEN